MQFCIMSFWSEGEGNSCDEISILLNQIMILIFWWVFLKKSKVKWRGSNPILFQRDAMIKSVRSSSEVGIPVDD